MNTKAGRTLPRSTPLVILLALGLAAAFFLSSCTPGSELTASESDVVITVFNQDVDFGAIKTYAMPDTIVHILNEGDEDPVSRNYDQAILDLIAANLTAVGYDRIADDSPDAPDVQVLVSATAIDTWYWYSYYPGDYWGWYGGYPGWGWGYPPQSYGTSYAYTTGTLFVDMVDPDQPGTPDELRPGSWRGVCNGILNDTESSKQKRFTDSINQMFEQSPYLRSTAQSG